MQINKLLLWLLIAAALPAAAGARERAAGVALSEQRLTRIDHLIEGAIEAQAIPGAVVLVQRRGQIAYFRAFGDTDRPLNKDALFRIASMTKPVTSLAVLLLHEEGRFQLDDPVSRYLPEFDREMMVIEPDGDGYTLRPATRDITIRHLLTHTSGIGYRFFGHQPHTDLYAAAGVNDGLGDNSVPLAENIRRLAAQPLAHDPGERMTYGLNTDVLGRLVEVVSGMSLEAFFQTRIFAPLGMSDTHFRVPADKCPRLAPLYRRVDGSLLRLGDEIVTDGANVFGGAYPCDPEARLLSGGAGLSATASDYARFLQMLLNHGELDGTRIASRKTIELMLSDQLSRLDIDNAGAIGFGVAIDGGPAVSGQLGSEGTISWGGYFNTHFFADPKEELIVILMTQRYPYGTRLRNDLQTLVYAAITD